MRSMVWFDIKPPYVLSSLVLAACLLLLQKKKPFSITGRKENLSFCFGYSMTYNITFSRMR